MGSTIEGDNVAKAITRVLMNSELPAEFPDAIDIRFNQRDCLLQVIRELPLFDEMPTEDCYRLIKKDRTLKEKLLTEAARKRLYDKVFYQMALRTAHEIFQGDYAKKVLTVDLRCVFEGFDPATGHPCRLVLGQLYVSRDRINKLKLDKVDPEVCFKELGGKTNGRPSNLKPIEVLPESGWDNK
jgi:restriction system protein